MTTQTQIEINAKRINAKRINSRTKLSARARRQIAVLATIEYQRSAQVVAFGFRQSEPTMRHAEFADTYAEGFVATAAVSVIGRERLDNLSGRNWRSLVAEAIDEHAMCVRLGFCHVRGYGRVQAV